MTAKLIIFDPDLVELTLYSSLENISFLQDLAEGVCEENACEDFFNDF